MRTVEIFAAIALAAMMAGAANIAAAQDAPKPVSSRVTAATVFLRGAELTQTASLTLKKGTNEISIEGLSPDIDRGSLRVNIGGGVVVSAHEFSMDYLSSADTSSPRLKMLRDSIDIYRARIDAVNVDIKINSGMQGYLETGIAKNVSGSEAGLGIDELKKTMDYYKAKSGEILNGARELEKRHGELSKALSRVRNQYSEESGADGKASGVLKLNLSAPSAGTYPVTITYYTPAASWSPYYDINAVSTARPITFAARSRVSQTTGLDWTNVRLTLSTSTPSNGKRAPLFSTWFLRERVSAASRALQGRVAGASPAAAEFRYYCAPRLDGATYLIAEIANREELDLLSAPANITCDGTYIGETWIDTSDTQEKLTLTLGSDKRVGVTRELAREFNAPRAIGGNTEQTFTYRITVRNSRTEPVDMVLKEQYPTSTDKSVTVVLDAKATTPWSVNKSETGVVTWEDSLAAGEVRTYTFSYTVKHPKDMILNL
jgi:hypothetical protein